MTFTDDELNAFFDKWFAWNNWKAAYEPHVTDPILLLEDGRLILAARAKELDTIASLQFEPRIDDAGRLDLRLVRVLGGNLPLPHGVLERYRTRLADSMRRRLPRWREQRQL